MKFMDTIANYSFPEVFEKYQLFEKCSRKKGQNLSEFLDQWNETLSSAQDAGCQYSDNVLACKLLEKVNLHQDDVSEILSLTSVIKTEAEIRDFILFKLESSSWRDREEEDFIEADQLDKVVLQIKEENLADDANCYMELDTLDTLLSEYSSDSAKDSPRKVKSANNDELLGKEKKESKNYRCKLCGKWYNRLGSLRTHLRSYHNATAMSGFKPEEDTADYDIEFPDDDPDAEVKPKLETDHNADDAFDEDADDDDDDPSRGEWQDEEYISSSDMTKTSSNTKFYQCKVCGKWFNRPGKLKAHYKTRHRLTNIDPQDGNHSTASLPTNKAPKTEADWKSNSDLVFESVGNQSEENPPPKKSSAKNTSLEKTVKFHRCDICGKWVNRIGKLKEHYRLRHKIIDADTLVSADNHKTKVVRGSSSVQNLVKNAEGKEKEDILASLKKKKSSTTKYHECQICHKQLTRPVELKKHLMNVHSDVINPQDVLDQYNQMRRKEVVVPECKICNKKFQKVTCYKIHMKIHSGVKSYKCDQCDASFYQNGSLRYHKMKHSGERSYKCDQCPNDYYTSENLRSHIRRDHLNERPFRCDYCDYAGLKKYDLERHMFSHVSERPVKCNICEKAFKDKVSLKVHTRKIHSVISPVKM